MRVRAVTSVPAPPVDSVHQLPAASLVDRIEFLLERARGGRVIHLGFVDDTRMQERLAHGSWLHAQLREVAAELVGIDVSAEGVRRGAELGFDVHRADCQSAEEISALELEPGDLLLAGELVEHLTSPGRMLEAIRPLLRQGGQLVVTTPNAHALTDVLAGLVGLELVNSDHVASYSWWTGRTLLARHGFAVREVAYYQFPRLELTTGVPALHRARTRAFNAYRTAARPLFRLRPWLAEGLILVAVANGDP